MNTIIILLVLKVVDGMLLLITHITVTQRVIVPNILILTHKLSIH